MAGKGDLHIHSTHSDGAAQPAEIARQAVGGGLSFISLTDHNCIEGVEELRRHLAGTSVRVIDGVEVSADADGETEIHILGYGVDIGNQALLAGLAGIVARKREQLDRMVAALRRQGVSISSDEIPDRGTGYVGRPALARLLLDKGVVRTYGEAFARFLGVEGSVYGPLGGMGPAECIELIHQAGGLAVLGHPSMGLLDGWVIRLAQAGLDGMEVYRPNSGGNEELYAEMVARDFGLVATAGSDWHGRPSECPLGTFTVDADRLAEFFARFNA